MSTAVAYSTAVGTPTLVSDFATNTTPFNLYIRYWSRNTIDKYRPRTCVSCLSSCRFSLANKFHRERFACCGLSICPSTGSEAFICVPSLCSKRLIRIRGVAMEGAQENDSQPSGSKPSARLHSPSLVFPIRSSGSDPNPVKSDFA